MERLPELALTAILGSTLSLGPHLEVDRMEGDVAVLVDSNGKTHTANRAGLSPGTREGVVLVEGKVDAGSTDRLRALVRQAQAQTLSRATESFRLDDPLPAASVRE